MKCTSWFRELDPSGRIVRHGCSLDWGHAGDHRRGTTSWENTSDFVQPEIFAQ